MNFACTVIPVIPETKQPALAAGFSYGQFQYGEDYRRGDNRQAGHVTSRNSKLVVIDIDGAKDGAPEFEATALGEILDPVLYDIVTYESCTSVDKAHVYLLPPDGAQWPAQWATREWAYDLKSNGFVRAEPAYRPTGNEPLRPGRDTWDALSAAIEADKKLYGEMFARAQVQIIRTTGTGAVAGPWADDDYQITSDNQLTADVAAMVSAGLTDDEIRERLDVILTPTGDPWTHRQVQVKIDSARKHGFDAAWRFDRYLDGLPGDDPNWRARIIAAGAIEYAERIRYEQSAVSALRKVLGL